MSFIMACTFVCMKVEVIGTRVTSGVLLEADGLNPEEGHNKCLLLQSK